MPLFLWFFKESKSFLGYETSLKAKIRFWIGLPLATFKFYWYVLTDS